MNAARSCSVIIVALLAACEGSSETSSHVDALEAVRPPVVIETEPGGIITEIARTRAVEGTIPEVDEDGDGFPARVDPDDSDFRTFPAADEIPCDGVDQDGDGADPCAPDLDADGVRADRDCDDLDANVSPFASEIRCNDDDENCDGWDDCDQDEDGVLDRTDPDPNDPAIPAREILDDRR